MRYSTKRTARTAVILLLFFAGVVSGIAAGAPERADAKAIAPAGNAKYVFVFTGDGMGMPQISACEAYLQAVEGSNVGIEKLSFSDFPAQGLSTAYAEDRLTTDSAAAATAIACGEKTAVGVVAMDSGHAKKLKTIAEIARHKGMEVGTVSLVDIHHGTPAALYSHAPTRNNYYDNTDIFHKTAAALDVSATVAR